MSKILTAERLNRLETFATDENNGEMIEIITAYRSLLSANAELSFSNMLLKAAYDKLLKEITHAKHSRFTRH